MRSLGLDALRGFAILLMVVSALTPRGLPNWMYHGNNPQFTIATDEPVDAVGDASIQRWVPVADPWAIDPAWIGMTWVDIVFPMFLFAMGAAIPLAFAGRLRRDPSRRRQVGHVLIRFLSLIGFAVYVQQTLPWLIAQPVTPTALWLALLAFVVLFALFTRLPRETPKPAVRLMRTIGLIAAVVVLFIINTQQGHEGFRWATNDVIILLLAWSSLVASLLWLATPGRPRLRLALGVSIAFVAHEVSLPPEYQLISSEIWGPVASVLNAPGQLLDFGWLAPATADGTQPAWADLSVLYNFGMLSCLWLVLPGMLVGDAMLAAHAKPRAENTRAEATAIGWPRWVLAFSLTFLGLVVLLAALQDVYRQWAFPGGFAITNPYAALLGVPFLVAGALVLWTSRPVGPETALIRKVLTGAAICAAVGVLLAIAPGQGSDFFEGGPRKVPGTLSWYFVSAGLIAAVLAAFMVLIDVWGWRRSASLLIDTGQNPMLAYMAARNLLTPLTLLPLAAWASGGPLSLNDWVFGIMFDGLGEGYSPWWKLVYGLLKVTALAAFVAFLTRRKLIWRT